METTHKSYGSLIAIIVIIALLVLGAFYFWGGKLPVSTTTPQDQAASVAPVSPSDDVNSIQGDLQATDPGPDLSNLNSAQ